MSFKKTTFFNKRKNKKTKKNKKTRKYGGSFETDQQNQMNTITRRMVGFMSKFIPSNIMNLKGIVRIGDIPNNNINTPNTPNTPNTLNTPNNIKTIKRK